MVSHATTVMASSMKSSLRTTVGTSSSTFAPSLAATGQAEDEKYAKAQKHEDQHARTKRGPNWVVLGVTGAFALCLLCVFAAGYTTQEKQLRSWAEEEDGDGDGISPQTVGRQSKASQHGKSR